MGLILLIIAIVLAIVLFPIGIIYTILKLIVIGNRIKFSIAYIFDLSKSIAIGIDQLGNIVCRDIFNDTMILKNGYKFGDPDETVSRVLGVNKRINRLTKFGRMLSAILNCIDKDHVEKASSDFVGDKLTSVLEQLDGGK